MVLKSNYFEKLTNSSLETLLFRAVISKGFPSGIALRGGTAPVLTESLLVSAGEGLSGPGASVSMRRCVVIYSGHPNNSDQMGNCTSFAVVILTNQIYL